MTLLDKCHEIESSRLIVRDMEPDDRNTAATMLGEVAKTGFFPAEFFPDTGVVVEQNGTIICIIPLYLESSSKAAVLGHFIANPAVDRKIVAEAARIAIEAAVALAQKHERKYIISIFGRNSINRIADKCGFDTSEIIEEKIYTGR
jgi:hypothetical protein